MRNICRLKTNCPAALGANKTLDEKLKINKLGPNLHLNHVTVHFLEVLQRNWYAITESRELEHRF